MRETLLARLRDALGGSAVQELTIDGGHVVCRVAVPPSEWPRRDAIRAIAAGVIEAQPGVDRAEVSTAIQIRTRDGLDRGDATHRYVALTGAGAAFARDIAAALRRRSIAAGIVDLDVSAPAEGAAESKPPINSDERIVPLDRDGAPTVAFARFVPVARLARLPRPALRAMIAQFFSLIVWPRLDVVLISIPQPERIELHALPPHVAITHDMSDAETLAHQIAEAT